MYNEVPLGQYWSRLDLKVEIANVEHRMRHWSVSIQERHRLAQYHKSLRARLAVLLLADEDKEHEFVTMF